MSLIISIAVFLIMSILLPIVQQNNNRNTIPYKRMGFLQSNFIAPGVLTAGVLFLYVENVFISFSCKIQWVHQRIIIYE